MRILHLITRSEAGGAQSVVRTLAEEQVARGHQVAIASGPEGQDTAWQAMAEGIELFRIPNMVRAIRPLWDLRARGELQSLYRRWAPEIIHVHTSKAGALGRLAWNPGLNPVVYTMHGFDQLAKGNPRFLVVDRWLSNSPRTGFVVAVSNLDAHHMQVAGYTKGRVVPNGTQVPSGTHEATHLEPLKQKLNDLRSQGKKIVAIIARDAKPKRIDLALEVARRLPPSIQVVWVGNSNDHLEPEILWWGVVTDVRRLVSEWDLVFLPSDHEGLPMVLLEALEAGVPFVASAVGAVQEIVDLGGGLGVENDPKAMAQAIQSVLEDPEMYARLGAKGQQVWKEFYSSAQMVQGYEQLYKEILGG